MVDIPSQNVPEPNGENPLAREFAQELLFVHAVFEGFAAVDKDDRDFIVELAAKFGVSVDVNLAPSEAAATGELSQALLDDLAEMAPFAGIDHDLTK
jgi:hypothetical protein